MGYLRNDPNSIEYSVDVRLRVCWTTELHAKKPGHQYTFGNGTVCKDIAAIAASTRMRRFHSYEVHDGDLTIYTQYNYDIQYSIPELATIRITAFQLGNENQSLTDTEFLAVECSTTNHTDEYVLQKMIPKTWHALRYEYMRTSPFQIYDEQRFVVESPKQNGTSADHPPVHMEFSPNLFYSPTGKIDHSLLPSVHVARDLYYKRQRVVVSVEAPCDNDENNTQVWLSDIQPSTRLPLDLGEVVCVHSPRPFCDQYYMRRDKAPHCDTKICYTAQILIDNEFYDTEQVREDVLKHYPSSSHSCSYLISLRLLLVLYYAKRLTWR
ncbi:unnamed protein product [Toxocara canis]|uniref:ZP domain-containing protein n=1 Tax=Toxocara canis TaxID=6265 RepID=A0A183VCD5_TOXCA|nr:unnamed protein product [Toxocara canis]